MVMMRMLSAFLLTSAANGLQMRICFEVKSQHRPLFAERVGSRIMTQIKDLPLAKFEAHVKRVSTREYVAKVSVVDNEGRMRRDTLGMTSAHDVVSKLAQIAQFMPVEDQCSGRLSACNIVAPRMHGLILPSDACCF